MLGTDCALLWRLEWQRPIGQSRRGTPSASCVAPARLRDPDTPQVPTQGWCGPTVWSPVAPIIFPRHGSPAATAARHRKQKPRRRFQPSLCAITQWHQALVRLGSVLGAGNMGVHGRRDYTGQRQIFAFRQIRHNKNSMMSCLKTRDLIAVEL